MLRHFLCVPYVRLHAETIVPARRPRFRRTNLLPRCLSKGFHADATNCKLVTPLGIHLLSARQRYYNLRTCSGQSEEVFPYLTPFTALGCAYERAPPGFPVQASRPRSASHPIGVDSLPIRILQGLLLHACTPIGRHGAKLTLINVKYVVRCSGTRKTRYPNAILHRKIAHYHTPQGVSVKYPI